MKPETRKSILSWSIDSVDLKNQIENYKTLKITKSYRGISVLIISAFLGFSLILSFMGLYVDVLTIFLGILVYLPILFFVYKGHRWAMIVLMVFYTYETLYKLYEISQVGSGNGIVPIIWWLIITPYFWKALKVENERRKLMPAAVSSLAGPIFCHKCGTQNETNSRFCYKCGTKMVAPNELN